MSAPIEPWPDDSPIDPNPPYEHPPDDRRFPPPGTSAPPPPRYAGSYPAPWDSGRPSTIPAAAVLAYIDAGLLILAGLLLLAGASAVDSWNNAFGTHNAITTELLVDGLINLLAAGLLIAGGVMISARSETGRTLLSAGGGLCIAAGLYWVARTHDLGVFFWTIVFVALPIIAISLAWTAPATVWLRGADPRRSPPRP
jgi:hypothetical protein